MKNINDPTSGKILIHENGLGEMTEGEVTERALELALIDGRSAATKEDRDRALAELRGKTLPPTSDSESSSMDSLSRDPSDPPANHGRQKPNYEGADEKAALERLVAEGVEEAQHDQMLAARRKPSP
ncbi:MAG: hypothetical protein ABIZ81_18365 [Opitutaceae bacterium]